MPTSACIDAAEGVSQGAFSTFLYYILPEATMKIPCHNTKICQQTSLHDYSRIQKMFRILC
jgi:hypothetical protein